MHISMKFTLQTHLLRQWIAAGLSIALINADFSLELNVEIKRMVKQQKDQNCVQQSFISV